MKKVIALLFTCIMFAGTASADTLLFEDFEDSNITYTTSVPEFSDGSGDFFTRTNGSNIGGFVNYGGFDGNYYFAGMDLDGEGAALPLTMTFSGIDISGYTNLSFSALVAEDDDGANEDWDNPDYVKIQYQIDGNGYQNLMAFENDGSTYNSAPYQDTDFNGIGDGITLTDCFALFSENIAGSGSLLDIQISFQLDSGDEDIAFDNITVTGSQVPVPGAILLLCSGLAALTGIRRNN